MLLIIKFIKIGFESRKVCFNFPEKIRNVLLFLKNLLNCVGNALLYTTLKKTDFNLDRLKNLEILKFLKKNKYLQKRFCRKQNF